MKNQNVKKIIAVMLAGTLLFGAAGIWTASAAEMSEDMEESAVEAETELTADSSASLNQTQVVADI